MSKILIIGQGGREHALAWKTAQSPQCEALYVAPGNAGTASVAQNVALDVNDFEGIGNFVLEHNIDMVIVGPEAPLVGGIVDHFKANPELAGVSIVGPNSQAAQLEGSKDFAKGFMHRHQIPAARSHTFTRETLEEGEAFILDNKPPYVLKADGLASGKGVIIVNSQQEAQHTLREMLVEGKFGQASQKVVIEEFLQGIELSVFILTDGKNYVLLPEAKDYKRIGEGDTGPNTGGMGAVSPVPFADKAFLRKVEENIIQPTLQGLQQEGIHYQGFIFFGLMKVKDEPYLIEYNARLGDPETQAVLPRLQNDLVALFQACAKQALDKEVATFIEDTSVSIVLAAKGYPGSYKKGQLIEFLPDQPGTLCFHAGTTLNDKGQMVNNGGRVLAITSMAPEMEDACQNARKAAQNVVWEGKYYRSDIGKDLLQEASSAG